MRPVSGLHLLLGKEAMNVYMLIATFLAILEQEVNKQHVTRTAKNALVVTLNLPAAWN